MHFSGSTSYCAPTYLRSDICPLVTNFDHKSRNLLQLNIPLCTTAAGQRTFSWNSLDEGLKLCKGSVKLKKNVKAKMLHEFLKQEKCYVTLVNLLYFIKAITKMVYCYF